MPRFTIAASCAALLLAGCASTPGGADGPARQDAPVVERRIAATGTATRAIANLSSASGSLVSGRVELQQVAEGVRVTGIVGGLVRNGAHGLQVHERGNCSAVDASSAGAHFNPAGKPHGKVDAKDHHAGDMNNLVADRNGVAQVSVHAAGVSLGGGSRNDIAGRAVIVHAAPDDYASQPAGNAGARVACGIITVQR